MKKILRSIVILVLAVSVSGQVDQSYYPLEVGNYWEYSTARRFYGFYSIFRQGIIDTVRIDNHLWYQQYSFWGVNDYIDLLRIDGSGNVLTHNETGIPDTLIILSPEYMVGEGRQWLVSSSGDDEVYGYLRPSFEETPIFPLNLVESQCIQANYDYAGVFSWATQFAPNIGKVRVMAEGAESFLHSMRLNDSLYTIPTSLEANQLDTLLFDMNSVELSCINNSVLAFDLTFDPSAFEWNSYSLYSIEFFVNPSLSTYELDFDAVIGDETFQFSLDSYTLSDTGYWDVISMDALPPLQSKSGLITIAGELSDTHHDSLPRTPNYFSNRSSSSESISKACEMGCESLQVRLVFFDITVDVDARQVIPQSMFLDQPYPNPFNPSTTIAYELPEDIGVMLEVYDINGRAVKILVNRLREAGKHKTSWDGTDEAGRHVPSGMYFVRLQTDDYSYYRKLVYLR